MHASELFTPLPVPALDASRRWLLAQSALLFLGALLLYGTFERTDLDRRLAHALFDAELGLFPLRHSWFLEAVMHKAAKQATYVLVAASLYLCWQGWRGRLAWLPARNALLAAIGMLAIPLATSTAKLLTARYCPWDLIDFGGYAPYLGLFEAAPPGLKAGQCFPAGHASTGFLWIVWAVALKPAGPRAARAALVAGVLAGGVLGTARMLQGAHFLSHTLWTLWLAWAVSVSLAVLVRADLGLAGRRGA
ncbi:MULTISPECIES: phosphatase PAP2 family protein [Thauera]|jgi:membrane-associated PAP2 superfamily phosphatase|uniref:Phosphatase PAP2 family protein n=1 Tax=Thauera aminoaromatica TaxID=164330 RepID=A0A5C7SFD7_THASP|nr:MULTISPECIES: phosphatase PAP2 family protein [Thauera]OPZ03508.1 MAG: PAP2 superfamily protein [Alphaproteobacteria bacterium ADurb.BinA305]MBP6132920.1 phosphatase PAP2 family protein [Thauera sp.]MBP7047414.1 phosphatase PAP2 family protein [Thauera sp.]MCK6399661.1 phosphatase PAP2 family protein [Thauera aminoaromatica]TXH82554.1 MAG: phosphatase PAP2 family protein [Thauera aminoaromatica]